MFIPLLSALVLLAGPRAPELATVAPNDNRQPAGTLTGKVLTISLEARTGRWYPEGPDGKGLEVAAWAEAGKQPTNPGPLIRVPVGTEVRATLTNTLARPLTVFGFGALRGMKDSVVLAPGAHQEVRFTATAAGTYYYMARNGLDPFGLRHAEDMELNGAIVIDPPGAASKYPDRIFLISWWFLLDSTSKTGLGPGTMTMNGLAWPHTERIDMVQGDSARWRIINLTEADHPMHLHGFYFRMESKGDGVRDTLYAAPRRRMAVTEIIAPFQTMSFAWSPNRPGNWIYHCHFIGHVSHLSSLNTEHGELDESALAHHASDRPHQMFGLVLGIRVAPNGIQIAETKPPRQIRLMIREKAGVYGEHPGYAYVLGGTPDGDDPNAVPAPPGPTLVLQRNEPVMVTILNQSKERAAVHWHGIELLSYPDGVPDWSGSGNEILPAIRPGDSLTVRFTPPRAGTFMYHSHFNEDNQISSGLYGAIVVLEPGRTFDPKTDRIMFFSSAGPTVNVITGPFAPTMLNGELKPGPIELTAGTRYRLRMINLTGDINTIVSLKEGGKPVMWRALAKDGYAFPVAQATVRPAQLFFDPGEIYDFEYHPTVPGKLVFRFGPPPPPPGLGPDVAVDVPVTVKR